MNQKEALELVIGVAKEGVWLESYPSEEDYCQFCGKPEEDGVYKHREDCKFVQAIEILSSPKKRTVKLTVLDSHGVHSTECLAEVGHYCEYYDNIVTFKARAEITEE